MYFAFIICFPWWQSLNKLQNDCYFNWLYIWTNSFDVDTDNVQVLMFVSMRDQYAIFSIIGNTSHDDPFKDLPLLNGYMGQNITKCFNERNSMRCKLCLMKAKHIWFTWNFMNSYNLNTIPAAVFMYEYTHGNEYWYFQQFLLKK